MKKSLTWKKELEVKIKAGSKKDVGKERKKWNVEKKSCGSRKKSFGSKVIAGRSKCDSSEPS